MKKIVIGIDVGISTTKIVGIDEKGMVISPIRIKATDPITSLYGAFGKYLHDNKIKLDEIEHVMLTGVGAAYIDEHIYGLPTSKSEEFIADGLGAKYESKLNRMNVMSMGTGTSLVKCDGENIKHIGGIGIGGGTLAGLSRIMLKTDDIKQITNLAKDGDVSKINLLIKDISAKPLPGLPMDAIASRRHRKGPYLDGAAMHRFCHYSVFARIGHQRFCTHRQPVAFALVPGSLSSYGEGVWSKIPCTQVFRILHCHRCGTRLQASTKIEHKNTSTKALFHTHLQERTDKQEVIRFGQPPFYRVVQIDFSPPDCQRLDIF